MPKESWEQAMNIGADESGDCELLNWRTPFDGFQFRIRKNL
jgi:hypothetical protein